MLSEAERRALEEIEHTLAVNDPGFAELLGNRETGRARRRARLAHDAIAIFSVLLGVACIALGPVGSGLVALLFAAVVIAVRRVKFAAHEGQPASRPGSSTSRP